MLQAIIFDGKRIAITFNSINVFQNKSHVFKNIREREIIEVDWIEKKPKF